MGVKPLEATQTCLGRRSAPLGVSAMAAPNVVNDRPGASAATRRNVRSAADRLGYSPRLAAHSLAMGRISRVALLLDDLTVPYATERVSGISDELAERGPKYLLRTGHLMRLGHRRLGEGTVNVFTRTDEVAVHELEGMISGRPHTRELKAGQLNGTAASAIATAWAPQLKRNAGG